MLLVSRSASQRAVQRHLNSVSLWISDDDPTMDAYYIVSTVSKIRKRHGSSCPGPLESRRRLGKRRLVYEVHRLPTSKQSLWSWLNSFREVDYMQWKWEPPRLVAVVPNPSIWATRLAWPGWLISYLSSIKKYASPIKSLEIENKDGFSIQEIEATLRHSICEGSISNIKHSYQSFKQALSKGLIEGTIREEEIIKLIDGLFQEFRTNISSLDLAYSLCYSLLKTIWKSLVVRSTETRTSINYFTSIAILRGLSNISSTSEVQDLIVTILNSITILNGTALHHEIFQSILKSWTFSWSRNKSCVEDCSKTNILNKKMLIATEDVVSKVWHMISETEKIIAAGDDNDLSFYVCGLKHQMNLSLEAIRVAEIYVEPAKLSTLMLAKILNRLPSSFMNTLLHDCSRIICAELRNHTKGFEDVGKYWLLLISQLSELRESEFLSILKYVDAHSKSFSYNLYPELLINRWASNGGIQNLELIRNMMKTSVFRDEKFTPWVCLISAIYQFLPKELHFKRIDIIFRTLSALGEFEVTGQVVLLMKDINPRLPTEIIEFIIESVSNYNPKMAWKIVLLSRIMKPGRKYKSKRFPKGDYRTIRFSNCLTFVMWMINGSEMNHKYIWRILGIPMHANYTPRYRNQPSVKPLHPSSINLYNNMAVAFAFSKKISSRVAFRCVMQCWHHLRNHKTPLNATIVKALVHSGLARSIENGHWVPLERLYWLLSIIKKVEGSEIAEKVEKAVMEWNTAITIKQARIHRESNVLNVGIID